MKYLLPVAVLMLMLSVGMSLRPGQLWENWRRLTPSLWGRLLAATFLVPPLLALALGRLLSLGGAATAGLFLVAVVPGPPLMTHGVAKKGFDMQTAASYQVWGALLTPALVPPLVAFGGWLYGHDIWVPPMKLLAVIARQQFLPFLAGMVLMWLAPAYFVRIRRVLNLAGNAHRRAGGDGLQNGINLRQGEPAGCAGGPVAGVRMPDGGSLAARWAVLYGANAGSRQCQPACRTCALALGPTNP
jgi:predicted Na+-dependent transporter